MKLRHNFKNLTVWRKSVDLAVKVYETTALFPSEERFGMTSQMRRSSVSIPSNIAEGTARNSSKAFSNCLDISLGESFELETQTIIATRVGLLNQEAFESINLELDEIQKMLIGLKSNIESNPY
ncbi:MAG TPA: four helix bundle protein [Algoriphagus sp.]|jgi:four helix bundle protein|uniref:Four helix bundle protein n=1 Tax=Algoriphagus ornithinivorans TaxID=226506 RepID=A0A1I5G0N8_9BACT|nr:MULTISPECIES: four helix bundle protein [Algoriphagus]MAL12109.1 four helix bundle protein [Algoriphagus sp.]MAN87041.1 four helix bundle protein [Algoriphagus sp.]QYH40498.1 four helix bundle protein [Algoriphagus sp. NBT04N3]SFO29575.1 four helix bundle protein [Algoriphagus ornithinivorans]HAD50745.1 four helix bundle protein [Algoriphagus sp.]|tara:strand:+ start:298 stop:669 length:372 start_codon:yes stop_codon:yes gene_type:complete